jgi:hypothetical protein
VFICSASATLPRTIADFVAHYHGERNYHGIDNELIPPLRQADAEGTVRRRQRMGGMLNYYVRRRVSADISTELSDSTR